MSFRSRLTATCTIQNLTTTVNAIGEVTQSYSSGTVVSCRITPLRSGGERDAFDRTANFKLNKLFIETNDFMRVSSRVVHNGQNFNVMQVNGYPGRRGEIHHQEIILERID